MKLSTPQIVTNSPQKTPSNNTLRSNSFPGIEETAKNQQPKLRRASIQAPSLPLLGRRSSVCGTLLNVPGSLKRELSDPILEQQEKQPTLLRRGSIAPRMRSGSVFGKSLGVPSTGVLRARRRSRVFSAREIKIFQERSVHIRTRPNSERSMPPVPPGLQYFRTDDKEMRPAFEKKPLVKRDGQNWWEMNKASPNTSDFEALLTERDRSKNLKTRLQSRITTVARKDSLPIITEPPDQTCFSRAAPSLALSEECNQSLGSRNEKIRICIKRWKKLSSNKSSVSATCPLTTGCHDHFEPLESFRRLARMVQVVIRVARALKNDPKAVFQQDGICKSFLEIMEGYMATREKHLSDNNEYRPGFSSAAPVFDPKQFKANREVKISKEVQQFLSSRPDERTSYQLQTILYALQTLESFSDLPLHMQQDVCKVAWLQSLPPNKIIIKQDHVADNFYFIINGSVTVVSEHDPTLDTPFTSLATLKRGSSFGETAILNNCRRTATVVSNDPVQLLVVGKEDYKRIFMGQTKTGEEPAHLKFCRSLDFLADWPVDLLVAHPENCLFHYFRRGTVIVKDSNKSDWLYIIVSGVCQVLLRLEIIKSKLHNVSGKVQCREDLSTVDKLADLTENRHRKTTYSASRAGRTPARRQTHQAFSSSHSTRQRRINSLPPVFPVTEASSIIPHQHQKKQTAFVQLGLLHPRSVFGLSTLLNFEEDFQFLQEPASVSLVSRGAECVMISKKFFINQASELTKKWIRHNVRSYPSRETLQRNLQEKINWDAYKQDLVQTVITR